MSFWMSNTDNVSSTGDANESMAIHNRSVNDSSLKDSFRPRIGGLHKVFVSLCSTIRNRS